MPWVRIPHSPHHIITSIYLNFYGDSFIHDILVIENSIFDECNFNNLTLTGSYNPASEKCQYINCFISNISDISGEAIGSRLSDYISIASGRTFSGVELVIEGDNTIVDLQNQPCTASFDVNSGIITFINAVAGSLIELNLRGGEIILDASCTGGEFYAEGIGTLYNGSAMTILENHLLALEPIADYVWNKTLP